MGKRFNLFWYYIAPCDNNPCQNNGECTVDVSQLLGYNCSCDLNYVGPNCEYGKWSIK